MNNSAQQLHQKLQNMMNPVTIPSLEGLETGSIFFPGSTRHSNLFDVIKISDDMLAYLLFDVAATSSDPLLTAAMAKIYFVNHVRQGVLPCTVMERAHNDMVRHIGFNPGLTAFVGYLDLHDNRLTYCNTGFSSPILFRRRSGECEMLSVANVGIGTGSEVCFEDQYAHLEQGDCFILYTDGLNELFAGNRETCSSSISFLRQIFTASAPELLHDELQQQIIKKRNDSPTTHDITVLYAEVLSQSRKNQLKNRLGFKESDKVYLQFFSYLEEMDRATANILSALDMAGFIDEEIRKMKIVLTELLVNAVVHGNRKDPTKKVVVGHLVDKNRATVSVMDEGTGFKPSLIPDPTLPENLEKPCGRGLFIVRHYVESISFNETASRVTIIKSNIAN